ncbi:predicted protein [Plenodomus lingam JN3]|uniref:Predicted protein n=1 Tax=Leptosphaeria maculans (strain JN3 / isolate v23.1.3 / race Av1-4-5-6-7-8) TaxID=985895 RepID=E5R5G2_LEPMJ|nr:predicted protein [Plenodomus lingam JN3]CBX92132.1 predicted protein [Plenodomus lingam JN3]
MDHFVSSPHARSSDARALYPQNVVVPWRMPFYMILDSDDPVRSPVKEDGLECPHASVHFSELSCLRYGL